MGLCFRASLDLCSELAGSAYSASRADPKVEISSPQPIGISFPPMASQSSSVHGPGSMRFLSGRFPALMKEYVNTQVISIPVLCLNYSQQCHIYSLPIPSTTESRGN